MNLKGFIALVAFGMMLSSSAFATATASPGVSKPFMGYAQEGVCAECHQGQAEAWSHSDHAWAMKPAGGGAVLGNFENTAFNDGASQAEFFRRGKDYWVKIEGEEGTEAEFRIAYTFGFYPLQQYLVELSRGRLQALTIAWDSRPVEEGGQRWFSLYPGMSFEPGDSLHWTGRNQNWNAMCADCHSTYLTMNYDAKADSFATTWQEQNVGCQGCHGPGEKHVDWAREQGQDQVEKAGPAEGMGLLVDFGGMAPGKVVETCAYCHSRRQSIQDGQHAHEGYLDKALPAVLMPDMYHADGQIQGEVYVYGSFTQSKMAKAGVTCLDCHDPHTTNLKIEGNGLCLQCHNPAPPERFPSLKASNYNAAEHHKHPENSEGAQCVNCHMTDETYMMVDPRRDHSFRIPRPDLSITSGSPNACNRCHEDKSAQWALGILKKWYPDSKKPEHFADTLQAFRAGETDAMNRLGLLIRKTSEPAIARATAAEHLSTFGGDSRFFLRSGLFDKEPLVRAYSAGAFAQIPVGDNLKVLVSLLGADQPKAVQDQALSALAGADLSGLSEAERKPVCTFRVPL